MRVDASLDPPLSRGLWLVKWLLLIPHFVVLAFLWLAFVVLTVVAFFAILVTGRYPAGALRLQRRRAAVDLAGALLRLRRPWAPTAIRRSRWPTSPTTRRTSTWPIPERLSRGLVLVKWWLLALPHYLVVAVFVGGGIWLGTAAGRPDGAWDDGWGAGGLVGLLVLIAGDRAAVHRPLPAAGLRLRAGHGPLGAAGRGVRRR